MPRMSRDFVELISSKRFNDTLNKLKSVLERTVGTTRQLTTGNPLMNLMMLIMQTLRKSSAIESRHKEDLENLAVELVKKEMGIHSKFIFTPHSF